MTHAQNEAEDTQTRVSLITLRERSAYDGLPVVPAHSPSPACPPVECKP